MSFKDIVTVAFKQKNSEAKSLIKMHRSEKKKVDTYTSRLKKITFNELFITFSFITITAIGLIIGTYGVYLSINTLLSVDGQLIHFGTLLVSLLALIFSLLTVKLLVVRFRRQLHDHVVMKGYIANVKALHKRLNKNILDHITQQNKKNLGINDRFMYEESEEYEGEINKHTSELLLGLKSKDSKKHLRVYIYNRSHITNHFTQVLYIHSTTLTVYSHFLHNSKKMTTKDLLDISFKSICINS